MISQAESISACCTVFDWPSIVAAFRSARHGPASRSAARRKTAARCSSVQLAHSARAASAASIAACASSAPAACQRASTRACACGSRTSRSDAGRHVAPADHRAASSGASARSVAIAARIVGALGRSRRVALDRLVDGRRDAHARMLRCRSAEHPTHHEREDAAVAQVLDVGRPVEPRDRRRLDPSSRRRRRAITVTARRGARGPRARAA